MAEVATGDYHPRIHPATFGGDAYVAAGETIRQMVQDQLDGKCRLRLVLREAVDLADRDKRRKSPYWLWSYEFGVSTITSVAEIVIEMRSGRQHVVRQVRSAEEARIPAAAGPRCPGRHHARSVAAAADPDAVRTSGNFRPGWPPPTRGRRPCAPTGI